MPWRMGARPNHAAAEALEQARPDLATQSGHPIWRDVYRQVDDGVA
jgi:hypothetical protein